MTVDISVTCYINSGPGSSGAHHIVGAWWQFWTLILMIFSWLLLVSWKSFCVVLPACPGSQNVWRNQASLSSASYLFYPVFDQVSMHAGLAVKKTAHTHTSACEFMCLTPQQPLWQDCHGKVNCPGFRQKSGQEARAAMYRNSDMTQSKAKKT